MESPGTSALSIPQSGLLQVVAGPSAGMLIRVGSQFRIGRAETGEGTLGSDPALSRHHATVRQSSEGVLTIEDAGSTNGTYVNDVRITEPRRLHAGDTLRVGETTLRVASPPHPMPHEAETVVSRHWRAHSAGSVEAPVVSTATGQDVQSLWRAWIEAALGGTQAQIAAATNAATAANAGDATQETIITAARAAWEAERPSSDPTAGAALRLRWEEWVTRSLGGTKFQIWSATEAAIAALGSGASQEAAISQARTAWSKAAAPAVNPGHAAETDMGSSSLAGMASQPAAPASQRPIAAPASPPPDGPMAQPSPSPSPHRQRAGQAPNAASDYPRSGDPLRGRVAGYHSRAEQSFFLKRGYLYVWDFRIERQGSPPVQVEMRGFRMYGAIADGDEVAIPEHAASASGLIRTHRLHNYTSGSDVRASFGRGRRVVAAASKIIIALLILAAIAIVIYLIAKHQTSANNG